MDETKTQPFYLVVKDKGEQERLSGKKRHLSKEIAIVEAERLRDLEGGRFLVLGLIAVRQGKKKGIAEEVENKV